MPFDFPASPSEGATYTPVGGPTYIFNSPKWVVQGTASSSSSPTGPAGGALAGTYPNPGLAVPYPTTLPPNGVAGGALTGSYPNPTLVGGPLSNYALASSIPTTLPPSGVAGGDLSGTYPNPTAIKASGAFAVTGALTGTTAAFTSATPGAKVLAVTGTTTSAAQDYFDVKLLDATGGGGSAMRVLGGPTGINPLYQVDRAGDTQVAGWHRALSLSPLVTNGADYFGYMLGNGAGGNIGMFAGSGDPHFSTFGAKGAIYLDALGAIPWYNVDGGTTWAKVGTGSGGASLTISDTPPGSPTAGAMWWNSVLGTLMVYYNDGNSSQWVPATATPQVAAFTLVPRTTAFTSSGTWTPNANMIYATLKALGGGGGSGGVASQTGANGASGGAGGAGSMSVATVSKATAGASQTVTIGTAGTAGAANGSGGGGAGGDSSVGTLCIGKGGGGGTGVTAAGVGGTGGLGGAAGTGDETSTGAPGFSGYVFAGASGGVSVGGPGGSSPWGGGGRNVVTSTSAGGNAGTGWGAGAAGAMGYQGAANAAGAAGSAGKVVIVEYCSQ